MKYLIFSYFLAFSFLAHADNQCRIKFFTQSEIEAGLAIPESYRQLMAEKASKDAAVEGLNAQEKAKNDRLAQIKTSKFETTNKRPFWARVLSFTTLGNVQKGPFANDIISLNRERSQINKDISKIRSSRTEVNGQINSLKNKMLEAITAFKKKHADEILAVMEKQIQKSALPNLSMQIKSVSSDKKEISYRSHTNQFWKTYKVSAVVGTTLVEAMVEVRVGFKQGRDGQYRLYSYLVAMEHTQGRDYKTIVESLFRRNTLINQNEQPLRVYNSARSIEGSLQVLGYDLKDPKTQNLIRVMKAKLAEKTKEAAAASKLIRAAATVHNDGFSDSQFFMMNNYFYYLFFHTYHDHPIYIPPSHWMMYNLTLPSHQHLSIGKVLEDVAAIPSRVDVSIFDQFLKISDPSVLTIKEAADSPEYKQALRESDIAESLGLTEKEVEKLDAENVTAGETVDATENRTEGSVDADTSYDNGDSGSSGGDSSPSSSD